jgi:hypothetical protein
MLTATTLAVCAGSATAAECGAEFWPGRGTLHVAERGGDMEIDVRFKFTQAELDALNCRHPAALEPDVLVSGAVQNYGNRANESNLPGSYNDTEFDDEYSVRSLTVGTTKTDELQPEVDYHINLKLNSYVRIIDSPLTVGVQFQRGRWASLWKPREAAACARGKRSDPAWCVFAAATEPMSAHGMTPLSIPNGGDADVDGSWGGGV